jgi:hypothetical protein
MTIPDLLQYLQGDSPLETVCGMYAGGADTTPRTTRCGRHVNCPPGTMMLPHVGPGARVGDD